MKKLTSILLALLMALTLLPTAVFADDAVAQVGDKTFTTLADAVYAVTWDTNSANSNKEIKLLKDTSGAGIATFAEPEKQTGNVAKVADFTIDFCGFTYTVNSLVGSAGTENQAVHIEKGDGNVNVTFKNGTLKVSRTAKILIQNYCNLTVENMTLDGTNLACDSGVYVLSNNDGNVKFTNCTVNAPMASNAYALDAAIWGSYSGAAVSVENCAIYGKMEVAKWEEIDDKWTKTAPVAVNSETGRPCLTLKNCTVTDLASAMLCAADGTTITLAEDISGMTGVAVPENSKFTVDFNGKTVTMNKPGAGSTGTETNGFQLLKNSTITFKNGTINVAEDNLTLVGGGSKGGNIKFIIQNYANLTLDNMTIDGTNLYPVNSGAGNYTMSNNCGNVTINNSTIEAVANGYAFDVYGGFGSYSDVTVTVKGNSQINGTVEVTRKDSTNNNTNTLNIEGGTFGNLAITDNALTTVSITGGTFTTNPAKYLPDTGYAVTYNGTNYVVNEKKDVDAGTDDRGTSVVEIETNNTNGMTIPSTVVEMDKELTVNDTTNKVSVTLNKEAVNSVGTANNLTLTVTTKDGKDNTNVANTNKAAYIEATKSTSTTNAVVVSIDLKGNDGKNVFTNGANGAYAIVTVPYKADMKNVTVHHLGADGAVTKLGSATSADLKTNDTFYYDSTNGVITMRLAHFSQYLLNGTTAGNTYHPMRYNGATAADTVKDKAESPKTADAGIAIYGVMAVSSVLGMGYMGKKKFF